MMTDKAGIRPCDISKVNEPVSTEGDIEQRYQAADAVVVHPKGDQEDNDDEDYEDEDYEGEEDDYDLYDDEEEYEDEEGDCDNENDGQPSLADQFRLSAGSWACDTCMVNNPSDLTKCLACFTPIPGTEPQPSTGAKFSDSSQPSESFGPPAPAPFSFKVPSGFPSTSSAFSAGSTGIGHKSLPTFSFGESAQPSGAPGSPSSSSGFKPASTVGLTFGSPSQPAAPTEVGISPSTTEMTAPAAPFVVQLPSINTNSIADNAPDSLKPGAQSPPTTGFSFGGSKEPTEGDIEQCFKAADPEVAHLEGDQEDDDDEDHEDEEYEGEEGEYDYDDEEEYGDEDGDYNDNYDGQDTVDHAVEDSEYDPNYEPIIALPDKVEVVTGDEGEDVIFKERAKLYRWDAKTKAWKERGVGDMKILQNPGTGQARILMRREQVLKVCANHRLAPEMKLEPMLSSDRAWVWFATDFAEGEVSLEKFAIKFKFAESAAEFKEAFDKMKMADVRRPVEGIKGKEGVKSGAPVDVGQGRKEKSQEQVSAVGDIEQRFQAADPVVVHSEGDQEDDDDEDYKDLVYEGEEEDYDYDDEEECGDEDGDYYDGQKDISDLKDKINQGHLIKSPTPANQALLSLSKSLEGPVQPSPFAGFSFTAAGSAGSSGFSTNPAFQSPKSSPATTTAASSPFAGFSFKPNTNQLDSCLGGVGDCATESATQQYPQLTALLSSGLGTPVGENTDQARPEFQTPKKDISDLKDKINQGHLIKSPTPANQALLSQSKSLEGPVQPSPFAGFSFKAAGSAGSSGFSTNPAFQSPRSSPETTTAASSPFAGFSFKPNTNQLDSCLGGVGDGATENATQQYPQLTALLSSGPGTPVEENTDQARPGFQTPESSGRKPRQSPMGLMGATKLPQKKEDGGTTKTTDSGSDEDVVLVGEQKATPEQISRAERLMLPPHFYLYEDKPPCPGCVGCDEEDLKPSLTDQFRPPAGSWTCDTCMVSNPADKTQCLACTALKPGAQPPRTTGFSFGGSKKVVSDLKDKINKLELEQEKSKVRELELEKERHRVKELQKQVGAATAAKPASQTPPGVPSGLYNNSGSPTEGDEELKHQFGKGFGGLGEPQEYLDANSQFPGQNGSGASTQLRGLLGSWQSPSGSSILAGTMSPTTPLQGMQGQKMDAATTLAAYAAAAGRRQPMMGAQQPGTGYLAVPKAPVSSVPAMAPQHAPSSLEVPKPIVTFLSTAKPGINRGHLIKSPTPANQALPSQSKSSEGPMQPSPFAGFSFKAAGSAGLSGFFTNPAFQSPKSSPETTAAASSPFAGSSFKPNTNQLDSSFRVGEKTLQGIQGQKMDAATTLAAYAAAAGRRQTMMGAQQPGTRYLAASKAPVSSVPAMAPQHAPSSLRVPKPIVTSVSTTKPSINRGNLIKSPTPANQALPSQPNSSEGPMQPSPFAGFSFKAAGSAGSSGFSTNPAFQSPRSSPETTTAASSPFTGSSFKPNTNQLDSCLGGVGDGATESATQQYPQLTALLSSGPGTPVEENTDQARPESPTPESSGRKPRQSPMGLTGATKSPQKKEDGGTTKTTDSGSDEDVVLVGERKASPEQIARAERLMLPPHFYLYEDKPPCPGCAGCDEEDLKARSDAAKTPTSQGLGLFGAKPKESAASSSALFGSSVGSPALFSNSPVTGISFASLSADNNSRSGFKKSDSSKPFAFAGAGAQVFGSTLQDTGDHAVEDSEYDPHYEPIIALPDKVEVVTGDEGEDVIFKERAKLYRWNAKTKAWRERGVGDMKILQNPETIQARILMRREQVLKVCANHRLAPEMKLEPMLSSDRAWVWFATDFAEEEVSHEKFAIKFKFAESAAEFKEAFDKMKMAEVRQGRGEKLQPSLADQFRPPAGSWTCDTCMVSNPADKTQCLACTALKPGAQPPRTTGFSFGGSKLFLADQFRPPAGSWTCDTCMVSNPADKTQCLACTALKPGAQPPRTTGFSFGGSKPSLADQFCPPAGSWTCDTCMVSNPADKTQCLACTALKPGAQPSRTTGFSFGGSKPSGSFGPPAPAPFSFKVPSGFPSTSSAFSAGSTWISHKSTPTFSFGESAQPSGAPGSPTSSSGFKPASTLGFSFGSRSQPAAPTELGITPSTTKTTAPAFGFQLPSVNNTNSNADNAPDSMVSDSNLGDKATFTAVSKPGSQLNPSHSKFSFGGGMQQFSFGSPSQTKQTSISFGSPGGTPASPSPTKLPVPVFGGTPVKETTTPAFEGFSFDQKPSDSDQKGDGDGKVSYSSFAKSGQFSFRLGADNVASYPTKSEDKVAVESLGLTKSDERNDLHFEPVMTLPEVINLEEGESPGLNKSGEYYQSDERDDLHFEPVVTLPEVINLEEGESPGLNKSGEYYQSDERDDLHFEPVVTLPEVVSLETGEEGEDVKFTHRAKLYRWDTEGKQWKEWGVGYIKVLSNSDTKVHRIVMRRDQPSLAGQFCPPAGSWTCDTCMINNPADRTKCLACSTSKPEAQPQLSTGAKFSDSSQARSDVAKTPTSQGLGLFGAKPKEPATSSSALFGSSVESPGLFSNSPVTGISFASLPADNNSRSGFKGSDSSKPFAFAGAGGPGFHSTKQDTDDNTVEDSEYVRHYKPTIALPVEVVTGDEGEDIIFKKRAKLYRWDAKTKVWRERGVGDMKILQIPETGQARILMRREQVLKVCANHRLAPEMELEPMFSSDRAWAWLATDFAEEGVSPKKFAIKFKFAESAAEFKEAFDKMKMADLRPPVEGIEGKEGVKSGAPVDVGQGREEKPQNYYTMTTIGSSRKEGELEDILLCSLCGDLLEDAKILECHHRFCKGCLAGVIDDVAADATSLCCPNCQHEHNLSEDGIDGIPSDLSLDGVLRNKRIERDLKNSKKEQVCSACEKLMTAVAICPHCGGFLCEACFSAHSTFRIFKSHGDIVTLDDIETGRETFDGHNISSYAPKPKCSLHEDMILRIHCKTCNKPICLLCEPVCHQSHEIEEIGAAGKRANTRILELIEGSKRKENILQDRAAYITGFRKKYESVIREITEQAENRATNLRESIKKQKSKDLQDHENKRRMIEERAEEKLDEVSRGRKFIIDEMVLMNAFLHQFCRDAEKKMQMTLREVKDYQAIAKLVTDDGNNWSVLRAVSEIEESLELGDELEDSVIKSWALATPGMSDLSSSTLKGLCWSLRAGRSTSGQHITEAQYFISQSFDISGAEEDNILSVAAVGGSLSTGIKAQLFLSGVNCDKMKRVSLSTLEDVPGIERVILAGRDEGHSYTVCIKSYSSSLYRDAVLIDDLKLPSSVICCVLLPSGGGLLVGLENSVTLYKCNLQAAQVSTVTIVEDNLHPPVSLAVAADGTIILCDGNSKALAVSHYGKVTSRFQGRLLTDEPLRVSTDRRGFVYILWMRRQTFTSVVMQYSPKGTVISEIPVSGFSTALTTMVIGSRDVVVLAGSEGMIQFYGKTSFGEMFGQYVMHRDDPEGYQPLSVWLEEWQKGEDIRGAEKVTKKEPSGSFESPALAPFSFKVPSGFPSSASAFIAGSTGISLKPPPTFSFGESAQPSEVPESSASGSGFKPPSTVELSFGSLPQPAAPTGITSSTTKKTAPFVFQLPSINTNSNADNAPDSMVSDSNLRDKAASTAVSKPESQLNPSHSKFSFRGGVQQFSFGSPSQTEQTGFSVGSPGSDPASSTASKLTGPVFGTTPVKDTTTPAFKGFFWAQKPSDSDQKGDGDGKESSSASARSGQFSFRCDVDNVASYPPKSEDEAAIKSPGLNRSGEDYQSDERDNLHFRPVVTLPEVVNLETGEEEEDVKFTHQAKLYRWDVEGKQWKERGVGVIKVLSNPDTKRHRIVMRRNQVLKVCANHLITELVELQPNAGSDRCWVWQAMDVSEGEVSNEKLAVRFKTMDAAKEFKEAVNAAKKET